MMHHILGVCLLCIAGVMISSDALLAAVPATPTGAATAGWTAVPNAEWKPVDFSRTAVAGRALPNLCDDFVGAASDLGAHELGRPEPHYGPRPLPQGTRE